VRGRVVPAAAGAAALVLAIALAVAFASGRVHQLAAPSPPLTTTQAPAEASPSATEEASLPPIGARPSPPPTQLGQEATPVPAGTVSPAPAVALTEDLSGHPLGTAIPVATSAGVPPAGPPATPVPTPDPAVWRIEGRILSADGIPLQGVCIVIGPHGCQKFSPHTDERGVYFLDVPQNPNVVYEIRFELEGYVTVYWQAHPDGPTLFNVVLTRPS